VAFRQCLQKGARVSSPRAYGPLVACITHPVIGVGHGDRRQGSCALAGTGLSLIVSGTMYNVEIRSPFYSQWNEKSHEVAGLRKQAVQSLNDNWTLPILGWFTMTDELLKTDISAWLRSNGLEVTVLEQRGQKTPDLLVETDGEKYLVEIKTKQDDESRLREEADRLSAGEVVLVASWWGPKNVIDGIVKEGVEQLISYADAGVMRLLWLHAVGRDGESQVEQFFHTLYGVTNIIDIFDRSLNRQCYYFYNSSFFRFRESLDGAVLSRLSGQTRLLLNSLSPRYQQLRHSRLAQSFANAVVNPVVLEETGKIMIADCDIDRNDLGAVKSFLQEKYHRPALDHIHLGRQAMIVSLPIDEADDAPQHPSEGDHR
jgi:hypothetical protein